MKTQILVLILCFCATQVFYSQEDDGVVSLSLNVRNSLTFNRYIINPTFSFVREQNKYISIYNKREWIQFEDAPLTYLASYTGRLAENIGAGLGVFQQNYGVLTTFGGVLNFAYSARLAGESNLTFGLNIGAYKSGINTGNVVTNFDDPSLQNVPENFLLTINPGINYGLAYIDFGVSVNNLVVYNFKSSTLVEDNPELGIQAHIMYTGYMNNRGFFDESKFSGLIRSEFKKDETIVSAIAMLTVPKGIWGQVGYNTIYGVSGGVGLNITPQIAIEYNFEKAIGDLTEFGPSHDITLAYRFKNKETYDYSSGDEEVGLISSGIKRKHPASKTSKKTAEINRKLAAERKAQIQANQESALKAKEEAQAKLLEEQIAKEEAETQAKLLAEQIAKEEAETQAKLLAEQIAKEEAETQSKLLAEQIAKEEAEAQAILLEEQKVKEEAEAQAKLLEEQKAKEEAEAQAILLEEQKAKEEAEVKLLEEQKAKEEAEAQAKLLEEQKAKEEAEAKLLEEQKAKEEAEAQAKLLAEQKAKQELITNPKDELSKAMYSITLQAEDSKTKQDELLKKIDGIAGIKNKDLQDLKEENDLSEQGIVVEPKPFKSINEENNILNAAIVDLDNVIESRNNQIEELKSLYEDKYEIGTVYLDEIYVYYKKTMDRLTAEQIAATQAKIQLELKLANIQRATEFERNRRIKRATFDNEEERYSNDRATLENIKKTTPLFSQQYKTEDFDFGEEQSNNIQILKNINHVDHGYYLIIAVHNNIEKRNDFIEKVIASGRANIDFFYDVNTSKYYIYYDKFDRIEAANEALNSKGNKPYNTKMSLVKIED